MKDETAALRSRILELLDQDPGWWCTEDIKTALRNHLQEVYTSLTVLVRQGKLQAWPAHRPSPDGSLIVVDIGRGVGSGKSITISADNRARWRVVPTPAPVDDLAALEAWLVS